MISNNITEAKEKVEAQLEQLADTVFEQSLPLKIGRLAVEGIVMDLDHITNLIKFAEQRFFVHCKLAEIDWSVDEGSHKPTTIDGKPIA